MAEQLELIDGLEQPMPGEVCCPDCSEFICRRHYTRVPSYVTKVEHEGRCPHCGFRLVLSVEILGPFYRIVRVSPVRSSADAKYINWREEKSNGFQQH